MASLAATLIAPVATYAIVIRPGALDADYVVPDNAFPALVDLPGEGQGVLVSDQWVATAAHATIGYMLDQVSIDGKNYPVAKVIRYPGFKKPSLEQKSGDAAHLMAELTSLNDIALIKLAKPVRGVPVVQLYTDSNELGKTVVIYGKGATGNGLVGQYPKSPHRGKLRRAYNVVTSIDSKWLNYRFDCGAHALPLEGVMGDGDSGGPVLIKAGGVWKLAGLTSWKHWEGDLSGFRAGVCGQTFSNVRISQYAGWINQVLGSATYQ